MKIILIRGPAGVGKTSISLSLAKELKLDYISLDKLLEENNLDKIEQGAIPLINFMSANIIIKDLIKKTRNSTVLDGCFYYNEQINDLKNIFQNNLIIITLKSDLNTCLIRNKERNSNMDSQAISEVYNLVKNKGHIIDTTNKSQTEVLTLVKEIISQK